MITRKSPISPKSIYLTPTYNSMADDAHKGFVGLISLIAPLLGFFGLNNCAFFRTFAP